MSSLCGLCSYLHFYKVLCINRWIWKSSKCGYFLTTSQIAAGVCGQMPPVAPWHFFFAGTMRELLLKNLGSVHMLLRRTHEIVLSKAY